VLAFQNSVGWSFDFSIRDFVIVITIACIMFTLFVKATTIGYFMRKFEITKLHDLEQFEYFEGRILSYLKMLEKLNNICEKSYVNGNEVTDLRKKYENDLKNSVESLKKLLENIGQENAQELIRRAL
jgi:NhaP-type Na+/H+ or K+/H+ antiporter